MDVLASATILPLLLILYSSKMSSATATHTIDASRTPTLPTPTTAIQTFQSSATNLFFSTSSSSLISSTIQTSDATVSTRLSTSRQQMDTTSTILVAQSTSVATYATVSLTSSFPPLLLPSPSTTTTPVPESSSAGLSGGQIAGIVIGTIAGCLLLVVLMIFCCLLCCYQGKVNEEKKFTDSGDFKDGFVAANVNAIPPEEEILSLHSFKLTFANPDAETDSDSDSS